MRTACYDSVSYSGDQFKWMWYNLETQKSGQIIHCLQGGIQDADIAMNDNVIIYI